LDGAPVHLARPDPPPRRGDLNDPPGAVIQSSRTKVQLKCKFVREGRIFLGN
jgi:hypothetical protein